MIIARPKPDKRIKVVVNELSLDTCANINGCTKCKKYVARLSCWSSFEEVCSCLEYRKIIDDIGENDGDDR